MKMRSQIVLAQLPTAMIISLIVFFFISILYSIKLQSDDILINNFKSILSMQSINKTLEELNEVPTKNLQSDLSKRKILESKIEQQLVIQDKNIKEPGEKELTTTLHEKWEAYKKQIHATNTIKNNPQIDLLYKEIKHVTSDITGLNQDGLIRKKDKLSQFISNFLLFIMFGSAISLIFGFFMSWFFTGLFLSPLDKMTEILSQVGREEKTIFLHIKGAEEIERLCNEFNLMTSRLQEYHQGSLGQVTKNYQILKAALNAIPDPVLLLDSQTNLIYINKAALRLLGFSGALRKTPSLFQVEGGLREALVEISNKVFMTKSAYVPEKPEEAIPIIRKDNKKIFLLPWAYPIRKVTGKGYKGLKGVAIVLQDLMRQPLSEISKADVYETLVHEFQSPLTEIHMAIHLCLQGVVGPLTEKQQEILFAARDKCDYLEKLYYDLCHLSEVNQKSKNLEQEAIDLKEVVSKLITSLHLEAFQKGIFINFEEPPYLSKIIANADQLNLLIGNLLQNAIHYADQGTIININLQETKKGAELLVNNRGPVILPEHRKNIFKKHFTVPGQAEERAGLGLYIASQIVQSMGGKIGVRSTEKQGTTFWVDLPIPPEK